MISQTTADYANISWLNFVRNLVPVTLGNLIGGAVLVGIVYWVIHLRKKTQG